MTDRLSIVAQPVAVSREDAAAMLGMGVTLFAEKVQPSLAVVRVGAKVLVPVAELERWVVEHSEPVLPPVDREGGRD